MAPEWADAARGWVQYKVRVETARDYRDLKVWQMGMALAEEVYAVARKLPAVETYALADQMRRAAVSIPTNLAEGQGRNHTKEFLQFACVARGSLAELETLLELAERLGYVAAQQSEQLRSGTQALRRGLYGLTSALRRKLTSAA